MTKQQLLQRLSEIEPEVCRRVKPGWTMACYQIGGYEFQTDDVDFIAIYGSAVVTGPPALAWLRDALERECERRGWTVNISISTGLDYSQRYTVYISSLGVIGRNKNKTNLTEALLAAFVAACETGKEGER